jgi:hypothetical protein
MPSAPCTALTAAGAPCGFPARRDTTLCINHHPAYNAGQAHQRQRATTALYNLDT